MAEKELYTVHEVAGVVGCTPQAIYKRLATNLKPFVTVVNGKKMLHRDVLGVLIVNAPTPKSNESIPGDNELIASMNRTIEILQHQMNVKDKQINELNAALAQSLKNTDTVHVAATMKQLQAENPRRGLFDWLRGK